MPIDPDPEPAPCALTGSPSPRGDCLTSSCRALDVAPCVCPVPSLWARTSRVASQIDALIGWWKSSMATLTRGWGCSRAWGCRRRARWPRCRERALPRGPSEPPPPKRHVTPQARRRRPRRRPRGPRAVLGAVLGAPSPQAPSWALALRSLGGGRRRPTRRPRARALPQATPSTCGRS